MTQTPQFPSITTQPVAAQTQQQPSQQIAPEAALSDTSEPAAAVLLPTNPLKRKFTRILAIGIILALAIALYFCNVRLCIAPDAVMFCTTDEKQA